VVVNIPRIRGEGTVAEGAFAHANCSGQKNCPHYKKQMNNKALGMPSQEWLGLDICRKKRWP